MTGLSLFARLVCFIPFIGGVFSPAAAHNLDTTATSISFANDFLTTMSQRAAVSQQLVRVGDEFWVLVKTTPGPGTNTGVGGYQTFYAPSGMVITEAAYVLPDLSDPRGFRNIPMKGQSPIAIGNGSVASATSSELVGFALPGVNGLGLKSDPVTSAGLHRGTLAGVYADTGIFYSTDPRTAFNSYGVPVPPLTGPPSPMTNNSGDTVGEYYAANVPNSATRKILGVMTLWDSYQLRAYGRRDVAPILDSNGRGNAPWGLANVVAGPQSGYAWEFDAAAYDTTSGTNTQKMQAAIKMGPWNRIKYPGSQISSDQPGLVSSVLGQAGIDASLMGIDPTAIPAGTKAIRFAIGQLELGRPEYSAVKVRVAVAPGDGDCQIMNADAFGGDAGGTEGGKDHMWRYFDPTVVSLNPCIFLQKVVSKSLVAPGETFHYDITFANNGTVSLPNFSITDVLPTGLVHVSAIPSQTSLSGQTLTWNFGTVAPGSFITIRHYVKATGTGTLFNTATALSGTEVVGVAQTSVEVGTRSILNKSKTVTPASAAPGGTVTYTLDIENLGTGSNGVPMRVREFLPTGFTYAGLVGATLNGAAISSPTIAVSATNPAEPLFTIAQGIQPGKKLLITFNALVGPAVQPGVYYNSYQLEYEGKIVPPIPEAPVTIGGAQIGDTVFRDWNGNGVQNPGEGGLPGVTVTLLLDSDGNGIYETTVGTRVTGSNGDYLFTGLAPGKYRVVVPSPGNGGVPSNYTLTADPDGAPLTLSHDIQLALNQISLTADWGYRPAGTGSIGDQVFEDFNKNGAWNTGEPGIQNVTVNLYHDVNGNGVINAGDPLIATQVTNSSGVYNFTNLDTNLAYIVQVDTADGDINGYFNTTYGNPANQLTSTNPRAITSGFTTVTTADFGFWRAIPGSIGDTVFIDSNRNGVYEPGVDSPLAGITVTLYRDSNGDGIADGPALATASTNSLGQYLFGNLGADTYLVVVDLSDPDLPAGLAAQVSRFIVPLASGTNHLTADFPFRSLLVKTVDKAAASAGETLSYSLVPAYTGSAALTNVTITDTIPAGSTYVASSATPPATVTPANDSSATLVTWNLGSNAAAAPGVFSSSGGSGSVTLTPTADSHVVQALPAANFGTSATLPQEANNRLYIQFNTSGIPAGATVTSASLNLVGISSGWSNGNVEVSLSPATSAWTENTITWDNQPTTNATAATLTTVNNVGPYSWSIMSLVQGWVNNAGSNYGAMLERTGSSTQTKIWGARDNTTPGSRPTLSVNYTSVGGNTAVALLTSRSLITGAGPQSVQVTMNVTVGQNTAAGTINPPATLSVTNTSGATVTLSSGPSPASQAVPIGGGTYAFTYNYSVSAPTAIGAITFSGKPTSGAGGFPSFPSNANFVDGTSGSVRVAPSLTFKVNVKGPPASPFIDNTAFIQSAEGTIATTPSNTVRTLTLSSIGDRVWHDANGNGIQDAGEIGIPGVTLRLFASDGVTLLGSAVSDASGLYRFYGVPAGVGYVVAYDFSTAPSGFVPTTPSRLSTGLIAAGTQYNDADFGLRPLGGSGTGVIGDYVWIDANNDGVQGAEELPLANIGITLERQISGIWNAYGSTSTNSAGFYQFTGLTAGNYRVTVNPASQVTSPYAQGTFALGGVMAPTYDADGSGTPHVSLVSLATNSTVINTADFGYNWSGSIGDFVWWDYNANGTYQPAATQPEAGIFNARVQLYLDKDFDGVFDRILGDYEILRVFTDASGNYIIPNLPPGNYFVDVYEDSLVVDGIRNVVPTTRDIVPVILGSGNMNVSTADFGYYVGARIAATVFWDENHNGIRDGGETLLPGITVTLTGTDTFGNPVTKTGSTTASGYIAFLVPEGNYTISYNTAGRNALYPALGTPTTVTSFEFEAVAGEDGLRFFDFGVDNTGSIGDTVFADLDGTSGAGAGPGTGDVGLAGVTVNLYLDLNGDGVIDFGAGDLLLSTNLTDANGNYLFVGLSDTVGAQRYVIKVLTSTLPTGYQITPSSYPTGASPPNSTFSTALTEGLAISTADFGYPLKAGTYHSVSGTIYNDNGAGLGTASDGIRNGTEPGIGGVRVEIAVNDQSYVVFTDFNGFYSFVAILQGSNVLITVDPSTLPSTAYLQTGDPDGGTLFNVWPITNVQAGAGNLNFGYIESLGSIAGTIVQGDGNGIAGIGEPVIEGVTVTLVWFGLDGIPGTDDDVTYPAITDGTGGYQFTGLFPGGYEITTSIPVGYYAYADGDGFSPNLINVNLSLGQAATDRDFEYQSGSLSGYLWKDDNTNGIRDPGEVPITGATVFLDLDGNGVVDPGEPSTTTDDNGFYQFPGLDSGTYQVRVGILSLEPHWIPTYDVDGVSTPNASEIALAPNQIRVGVNFGFRDGSWSHWQLVNPLDGKNGPSDNPDADRRDNLMEFALASDPESGTGDGFSLAPSASTPGTLDVTFTRPTGATLNVTYILEFTDALIVGTTWTPISLSPENISTVDNEDGTETVTVSNIEILTGLVDGKGFIRLVVVLNLEADGSFDSRSSTEVEGWTETRFGSHKCQTYNVPYQRGSTFSGTVSSVSVGDQTLTFHGEDLSALLTDGVACYAEVTVGDNEGQRFDVQSAGGESLILATDDDLYSATAPFGTHKGALPENLVGDRIIIRQHWTLDQVFPPNSFNATSSHTTSDQVLVYNGSSLPDTAWSAYWLYNGTDSIPATARWVRVTDETQVNQGGVVIPPGQGMFFFNRGDAAVPLLSYGEVRQNLFRLPVCKGLTHMGGGYPVDQSPASRVMNNSTFFGSTKFSAADTIMIWNADSSAEGKGYTDRWLLNAADPFKRWVKIGDNAYAAEDAQPVFKADRAAFFRAAQPVPTHSYPAPWSHSAP